jgi:glyoxylase-like metal-dependent hydrolase (beta-lactamase superfamily II)/8-oxo-dGTP pyrophosphatase MutT (NUDIX family)
MSEVPAGLSLGNLERRAPRPSATLMVTRDGKEGVEVLLGRRAETMPAFPEYWAFPGGGIARCDRESVEQLPHLNLAQAAMFRELVEELGLAPKNGKLVAVDEGNRMQVVADKNNWLSLVKSGEIPCDNEGVRLISKRTTPPFGPMRFENSFLHIHAGDAVADFSLSGQTEFVDARWVKPNHLIDEWKNNSIKVAPPVVSLLIEVARCLENNADNMNAVALDLENRMPGRNSILFAYGVEVVPVPTATLPPADHTNSYLVGDPEGDFILVDPACRSEKAIKELVIAVERHQGDLVAMMFTHRHLDHLGDVELLKHIFPVPIWASKETATAIPCDRILVDGELLQLGHQQWQVLDTPGHCTGHLCLFSESGLIAGDMVAGIGTILIPPSDGDMNVYLEQLRRLSDLKPHLIFPSHGPVIPLPLEKLEYYITHRRIRHQRVLAATSRHNSTADIAKDAYSDSPDAHPILAEDQTLAHLLALEREQKVVRNKLGWVIA